MKRGLTALLLSGALGIGAIAVAQADVQPDEHYNHSHCRAASDASDWVRMIVYCRAEAEDNSLDAADEPDHDARALDMTREASCLANVGFAYAKLGKSVDASGNFRKAREILGEARAVATDPNVLNIIAIMLKTVNGMAGPGP
jgi:hypothetical protein